MTAVLDASAVLALLRAEPGHEQVAELVPGSVISAVNYSEVVQKLAQLGSDTAEDDAAALVALGTTVAAFDVRAATNAARLWPATRRAGLSLADRACLALAADLADGVAVTADRAWAELGLDIRVRFIR
ncbi:PIN domain nuclease, a component of toxin-antitoxin system (PIN domain) [Amycolatopsis arida]|uniref:Ribonuclease VapC n=1 Tax=Amycolatopsis arida TaxID=587909 RepID=A0A1I5ZWH2_9PSEU|nr:type II toxin-antitoxin system VapC family toxin [Amycolatopsis arida]TDX89421.1 PIN domain nuclease of toxin-antitoxin system [Amycolatopsis arida]SFQ60831.1 PIN domain nuclease, a component of toxin-antitoxin system (PIN domain) [Amycolatopsis arida]